MVHALSNFNPLTFTMESNYATGPRENKLAPLHGREDDEMVPSKESFIEYTPEIWNEVGLSILMALMDYDSINPASRLIPTLDECMIPNECKHDSSDLFKAVQNIRS